MGVIDLTPAMKQYVELKARYEDCILFFRMGDFYEMFFEDAVTASKILDITLTTRNKSKDGSIPLCGFPYHAASSYIARLIEKGFKVAICEQMEDPKLAKGVVKRDVIRVITPGLVVDPDNLDAKENNFLAALYPAGNRYGLAFVDISTGEFRFAEFEGRDFFLEIAGLNFREIILPDSFHDPALQRLWQGEGNRRINRFPEDYFDRSNALERLKRYFPEETMEILLHEDRFAALAAVVAVLRYIEETQKERLGHINRLEEYRTDEYMVLDDIAKQTLELFSTIQEGKKKGSLLHILDETVTAMGGRRLRWWLHYPLMNPEKIKGRLGAVYELRENHILRETLRRLLSSVYDLERLGARIAMDAANARDLNALKISLSQMPEIRRLIEPLPSALITAIAAGIDEMADIRDLIEQAVADEPPLTIREGGIIREGYDRELDELIGLSRDGKKGIAALEATERARTGINSLKVGFNNIFGYYIEVTKTNAHLVPGDYVRKQTLVNAERYINQALKEYEHAVLNAEDRRRQLEYEIFISVRNRIVAEVKRIQTTASCLADLDVLQSMAYVAEKNQYCCPIVDAGDIIEITDGRHPVVEQSVSGERFVPNDTCLDCRMNRFLIITGPNMAGKSTFIRQVALIVILAQMGSFVPASKARIGVVDKL
ncbi:MAG: DNA mismatch repair protein MutS, partial [Syntrophales bacterium]|nr:DNA mismatch repair protein MutS [Syntrophales bacterium]